jgi:hypothetical protein
MLDEWDRFWNRIYAERTRHGDSHEQAATRADKACIAARERCMPTRAPSFGEFCGWPKYVRIPSDLIKQGDEALARLIDHVRKNRLNGDASQCVCDRCQSATNSLSGAKAKADAEADTQLAARSIARTLKRGSPVSGDKPS